MKALRVALCAQFIERQEVIDACLTALTAGENICMLGPPGTAKTQLWEQIAQTTSLSYFYKLLTKFTTPEEVFGPLMLSALKEDRYERAITGYMACAQLAVVDECFKANSAILNSTLGIMNERTFRNGTQTLKTPLVCIVGLSNEMPEGPELEAYWDRFMSRVHVDYIADRDNFLAMLAAPANQPMTGAGLDILAEQAKARLVTVTRETLEALADMRGETQRAGMRVSDRRWRKSLSLVRATAHLSDQQATLPEDLGCLENVLWHEPAEYTGVVRLVQKVINPNAAVAVGYLDAAKEAYNKIPLDPGTDKTAYLGKCAECNQILIEIQMKLANLGNGKRVDVIRDRVKTLHQRVSTLASKALGLA